MNGFPSNKEGERGIYLTLFSWLDSLVCRGITVCLDGVTVLVLESSTSLVSKLKESERERFNVGLKEHVETRPCDSFEEKRESLLSPTPSRASDMP